MNSKEPAEEPPVRSVFKRSVVITIVIGAMIGGIYWGLFRTALEVFG